MESKLADRMVQTLAKAVAKISKMKDKGELIVQSSRRRSALPAPSVTHYEGSYITLGKERDPLTMLSGGQNVTLAVKIGTASKIFMITRTSGNDGKIGGESWSSSTITGKPIKELRDEELAAAITGCLEFMINNS